MQPPVDSFAPLIQAFEWNIDQLSSLRDTVEQPSIEARGGSVSDRTGVDDIDPVHHALKEAPILGDGRWMLEISRYH